MFVVFLVAFPALDFIMDFSRWSLTEHFFFAGWEEKGEVQAGTDLFLKLDLHIALKKFFPSWYSSWRVQVTCYWQNMLSVNISSRFFAYGNMTGNYWLIMNAHMFYWFLKVACICYEISRDRPINPVLILNDLRQMQKN